jgi:hypothetical protein
MAEEDDLHEQLMVFLFFAYSITYKKHCHNHQKIMMVVMEKLYNSFYFYIGFS